MGGRAPRKQFGNVQSTEVDRECAVEDPTSDMESRISDDVERDVPEVEGSTPTRKRKRGTSGRRTRGRPETRKKNSIMRFDTKLFERAEENQVMFNSFSLIEEMEIRSAQPVVDSSKWILWDEINSRAALDSDGIPVLYHFPKLIRDTDIEGHTTSCLRVGEKVTLTFGGSENEDWKSSYVENDGEVSGRVEFALAVAPETKDQPAVPSASILENLEPLKIFLSDTEFLSERVSNLISLIDPAFHDGLERLQEIIGAFPNVQEFATVDAALMEGRSIVFNQKTPLHATVGDFEAGWRVLISLGSFTEGGYVRIPRLGLRVRFLPGDVLVLRGASLEYEVEAWSGGQKVCLEHFTCGDLWKHVQVGL